MEGLIKSLGLISKVEDVSDRTISAYWSAFGNKDYDDDVMVKGAFKKTITDRSKENPVLFLKNHNFNNHISTAHELIEDSKGLLARYKLPNTTQGNDSLEMYKEGFYNQHSIGFKIIQQDKESDANYIKEVKLFEGSVVPFGANPLTPMVSITKSLKFHYDTVPNSLQEEYDNAMRIMKSWKGSDESFLEIQVKALILESYMKDLNNTPQPETKEVTRERIELKGMNYEDYQKLPEEKQTAYDFINTVEYHVKCIAGECGKSLLYQETYKFANDILAHCKSMNDYLETAEDAVLNGTTVIENESEEEQASYMPKMTANTDPLYSSQPKGATTGLEELTKSLLKK
jgi:HK97 family phage prohead protease